MKVKLLKRLRKEARRKLVVSVENGCCWMFDESLHPKERIFLCRFLDRPFNLGEAEERLTVYRRDYIVRRIWELKVIREIKHKRFNR